MRRIFVNMMCMFVPSRNLRYRIRKRLIRKSRLEKVEEGLNMLYYLLENCVGVSNLPRATGGLRLIQEKNVELLEYFDGLCKKYDLEYWLDFGTLLGAVRHGGFIPWDDDLDVGMFREDYEKLLGVLEGELEKSNHRLFFKNEKPRKQLLQITSADGLAQLDVFPYDFYYKKIEGAEDEKNFYRNLYRGYDEYLNKIGYGVVDGNIEYSSEAVSKIVKEVVLEGREVNFVDRPSLFWGIEFYHSWNNKYRSFETMLPLKKIEFEGLSLPVPNDFDRHLRKIYGNYWKMPRNVHCHEEVLKRLGSQFSVGR